MGKMCKFVLETNRNTTKIVFGVCVFGLKKKLNVLHLITKPRYSEVVANYI